MKKHTTNLVLSVIVSVLATSSALAAGDSQEGERVFQRCAVCHALSSSEGAKIGPHLEGMFGRQAGTLASFQNYSPAMKKLDVVWTEETLNEYIAAPQKMVPGTTMAFAGIPDEEQREDLIAYLKQETE